MNELVLEDPGSLSNTFLDMSTWREDSARPEKPEQLADYFCIQSGREEGPNKHLIPTYHLTRQFSLGHKNILSGER